jgi:hypothetical protein
MPNVIDNAIARLQDIALACTSVTIKSAPDYPIENADPFPMAITHLAEGEAFAVNSSTLQFMPTVNVDFHFSRINLKQAYQQSDLIALEYLQRLAGDPTLNGVVDTIQINGANPVTFAVEPVDWGGVISQMLRFVVQLKTLETPLATT